MKMLRLTTYFNNLTIAAESITPNFVNYQSVRYYPRKPRKPFSMGRAKTKMFKIPPRPQLPKDEEEELKFLHNNYRTMMKSITNYLTIRYNEKLNARTDTEQIEKAFAEDFLRCNAINDEWNAKIKAEREQRNAEILAKEIELAKSRLDFQLKKKALLVEKADEIVRKEIEASKHFITPEILDEAIEHALNNPVDYNFAIDLKGNKIMGRETKPDESETQTR